MPDSIGPSSLTPTSRSRMRRHHERGHYDRETLYEVLDASLMAHIGYVIDGQPYVTPTLFWRDGGRLYWHGSSASRMLRTQRAGIPVCVTVSHMDGLVLARSAFRHSMNYRAVMAFGTAAVIDDPAEKEAGFNAFIERLYPGRTGEMRGILPEEIKATMLMSMVIEEASAKIRNADPVDLEPDYAADCWAGIVPLTMRLGAAVPDAKLRPGIPLLRGVEHLAEGAALDQLLLMLARGEGR